MCGDGSGRDRGASYQGSDSRHDTCGGKKYAETGPTEFSRDGKNVAAGKQSALAGDGETETHAALLERDGWLEQRLTREIA
jgi:hypothetical protein